MNYKVNYKYIDFLKQRLNIEKWLNKVFAYVLALSISAERTARFSYVDFKPYLGKPCEKPVKTYKSTYRL
ncbi:MAG: hypothetical protein QXJ64_04740 [Thermosphaera sp.]